MHFCSGMMINMNRKQRPKDVLKRIPRGKWTAIRWHCQKCKHFWVEESKKVMKFCINCDSEDIHIYDWW